MTVRTRNFSKSGTHVRIVDMDAGFYRGRKLVKAERTDTYKSMIIPLDAFIPDKAG